MEDTMHDNTTIEGVEGEVLEQVVEPEQVGVLNRRTCSQKKSLMTLRNFSQCMIRNLLIMTSLIMKSRNFASMNNWERF
jgi:hypothetical protein